MSLTLVIPKFPSIAHEKSLKEKLSASSWTTFTTDEKTWWHTYVYAWRKVFLGLDPTNPPPTDPRNEWLFPKLYHEALQAYDRGKLDKDQEPRGERLRHSHFVAQVYRRAHEAGQTLPRDLREDDQRLAKAIHDFAVNPTHQQQNRKRAQAFANVKNWRQDDAGPTDEAIAYVELCVRQIRANVAQFVERNAQAARPSTQPQPNVGMTLEELTKRLGLAMEEP